MNLAEYKKTYEQTRPFLGVFWYLTSLFIFETLIPFPSILKSKILRMFGATIGTGVVIKPNVKIKYPWKLSIGSHSWLGEKVWIDNLAHVVIGENCCISQSAYILTGSHNYRSEFFDLEISEITLEDEVWIGARAVVAPGSYLKKGVVLTVNSVATSILEQDSIYQGNPAIFKRKRYK
ncbi:TPA: colanic acid biosynthesis acetyltransferase WcaF [Enterobacter hormaechei]|uniref:WcaF family extracellular polysaccharide biosynthesis acetyltransferase n=1 Tax=Enterobacter hormaechei TaxID=158836 RepID=UPI0027F0335C|nr:WcaF family extracellular polysaccharide biosynthesis acetyltransferase [Enterobacter hormaechei]EKY3903197.1 colanic acid biosynthesis acetyltransferase WcaF [Enterobacter hormaechei]MDR9984304.1 WcaF family extracellular polysaccharide biosynthesis acetyltransferase [Enterobacter hormaechei subsp. steigerwaltii]HBL6077710.1 colanic acid biosynthesis acetyltransferase WcaF [Enterobacter hormaechei]HBL8961385.1 colanic acid biosynthesis acetyltransferase WcaF [Enterobacter hormaechei]HBL907